MVIKTNWVENNKKLTKTFEFKDFKTALKFVNKIGEIAEELQHHPDIKIYDYKNVLVETSTHEENAITEKDHELAKRIDRLT